jgi:diacylglycerol kinase
METRPFQFTGRIRSFGHAITGIIRMVRCQHNAWIHSIATGLVIAAGFFFHLSPSEWCWIVLAASIVWTAEALNTAFEFLADAASPNFPSHSARRQGCSCRRGAHYCGRLISDRRNNFLAACEGPTEAITRSTGAEFFCRADTPEFSESASSAAQDDSH